MSDELEDDLRQRIADRQVIAVIGAGVSMASVDSAQRAIASWPGLLESGVERLRGLGRNPPNQLDAIGALIAAGNDASLIAAAELITEYLGGSGGAEFRRWLAETAGALKATDFAVLHALRDLRVPLITTNYDGLLETATGRGSFTWKDGHELAPWLNDGTNSILHLHGHFGAPESVVLGVRSYDAIARDDLISVVERALPVQKTLLFVGCGAGLDDPNFATLLQWMAKALKSTTHRHYRLCLAEETGELWQRHSLDSRIVPLPYGESFQDLPRLLTRLVPPEPKSKSAPPRRENPEIDAYRAWAASELKRLRMRALLRSDVEMDFDQVFVPLRLSSGHEPMDVAGDGAQAWRRGHGDGTVVLERLFAGRPPDTPHALILGDPGAGKTTALKKVAHLLLQGQGETLGLSDDTLPVFLRLRAKKAEHLTEPLGDYLERELQELSEKKLPKGIGNQLIDRGRLLLLLDGLDEIADETLRARMCRALETQLAGTTDRGIHALVSCRRLGYRGDVRLSERFARTEVRQLDQASVEALVTRWFGELIRKRATDAKALGEQRDDLVAALHRPPFSEQRYAELVGNPLLLTILCVVRQGGHPMPQRRAQFFKQCLDTLLSWRGQPGDKATIDVPIDTMGAEALLRPIAWELHHRQRRDDLTRGAVLAAIRQHLGQCDTAKALQVLAWLHEQAAVLDQFAPHRFGFFHLGLQEYLAAAHAAANEDHIDVIARGAGDETTRSWWLEIVTMLAGIATPEWLAHLLRGLLRDGGVLRHAGLIRDCLAESASEAPDVSPLLDQLEASHDAEERIALLRLLHGRKDAAVLAAVTRVVEDEAIDAGVRDRARECLAAAMSAPERPGREHVLLVFRPEDRAAADAAARALLGRGLRVWQPEGRAPDHEAWLGRLGDMLACCKAALWLAVDPAAPPWEVDDLRDILPVLADELDMRAVDAGPSNGGRRAPLPAELDEGGWLDMAAAPREIERPRPRAGATRAGGATARTDDDVRVEPRTGIRFLRVPAGTFLMGREDGQDYERPVHRVRVEELWLGETPVTNRQYEVFRAACGADEPAYWRDRRFNDPEQPVVGVSWHDANAFCAWLTAAWQPTTLHVRLPREDEWEYSARGEKSFRYPWGDRPEPTPAHACFGLDWDNAEHRPARVGSCPAGKGPFGHLDLAGLVWEWCEDAWSTDAYKRRAKGERIHSERSSDPGSVVLRGGSWLDDAGDLATAVRFASLATDRNDCVGFRVVSVPASTVRPA